MAALARAWPSAVGIAILVLLATPVLAPHEGSPEAKGPGQLSRLSSIAEEAGYTLHVSALSPTQSEAWADDRLLTIVKDPARSLSSREASHLSRQAASGTPLLVLDGTGGAWRLLDQLGVAAGDNRILDAQLEASDLNLVAAQIQLGGENLTLRMDQPLPIGEGTTDVGWSPLARTSPESFVDLNGNGRLDGGDTRGPFLVGVRSQAAPVIILTSGAFLEDRLLDARDGQVATRALLTELLPEGGTIVVDTSHAEHGALGDAVVAWVTPALAFLTAPVWAIIGGLVLGTGVALLVTHWIEDGRGWDTRQEPSTVVEAGPSPDIGYMRQAMEALGAGTAATGRLGAQRLDLMDALDRGNDRDAQG